MRGTIFVNELAIMCSIIRRNIAFCRLSEMNTMMKINGITEEMWKGVQNEKIQNQRREHS